MIGAFRRLGPPLLGRLQRPAFSVETVFSVKAIHSVFPASLLYYRPKPRSSLFDHAENEDESRRHDLWDEGVVISKDGLVYPGVRHQHHPLGQQNGRKATEKPLQFHTSFLACIFDPV